jgi:hypothetical protein
MPVYRGLDVAGSFYKWGTIGKKYYYKSGHKKSRENAKIRARKQGIAIKISQSK